METRDRRDTTRNNSPLVKGDDAIYINTTKLSIEEVFGIILKELEFIVKK
ncbi:MAG: (d)CMP kinase [Planctomycetota bacterium]